MVENGTFNHLVSNLQQSEKLLLLEKIKSRSVFSAEQPLINDKEQTSSEKAELRYQKLSFIIRFWYWLVGLFTGRAPIDIFLNALAASEGRLINEQYPGIFDYQENLLLNGFCRELQNLKDASRFFYTALDSSYHRDKGAFLGYLGSLAMPDTHESFVNGSDPEKLSAEHPEMIDAKLKATALEFIESELNTIPESQRTAMYEQTRMLVVLKKLSSFLYDRLIMAFNQKSENGSPACPVNVVRIQLNELVNILFSFKKIPSMDLLSALFMFSMAEYHGREDFDIDKELQRFLQKAEKSLMIIKNFNNNIPLLKIIRCASREFSWEPIELSGGEDWFSLYKTYWVDLTTANFTTWIADRKNAEIMSEFDRFFQSGLMLSLDYAWSATHEDGIPVEDALTVSFLLTFHKLIFMPEINVIIRPILVDGDFYKKENRIEFMEAYNIIIKLDDIIKAFDSSLSPSGEYGKIWAQIAGDMQSLPVRRRKTQTVLDEVNFKTSRIIEESRFALLSMEKVLTGIIERDENSKYDTLTNFAKIAGKGTVFSEGLHKAIQSIKTALEIMADIAETRNSE